MAPLFKPLDTTIACKLLSFARKKSDKVPPWTHAIAQDVVLFLDSSSKLYMLLATCTWFKCRCSVWCACRFWCVTRLRKMVSIIQNRCIFTTKIHRCVLACLCCKCSQESGCANARDDKRTGSPTENHSFTARKPIQWKNSRTSSCENKVEMQDITKKVQGREL